MNIDWSEGVGLKDEGQKWGTGRPEKVTGAGRMFYIHRYYSKSKYIYETLLINQKVLMGKQNLVYLIKFLMHCVQNIPKTNR